ncbi:MAG: phosphopyruvate hydratase [Candidatus Acidiferrales bacterium]
MGRASIERVNGRRLWDSRGRPTVEVEVTLTSGASGRALAPAGASRGTAEAIDHRDGGSRFGGQDVTLAVAAVNTEISAQLRGMDANNQAEIDAALIALDGTPNKSRLGGNATVAVSMAVAHASANAAGLPLWRHLARDKQVYLPLPEIQIFGGGAHAGRRVDVQDFMIVAVGASDYTQALDWSAEVYRCAGEWMAHAGLLHGVADEGGFWPAFSANSEALDALVRAIELAGFRPGEEVAISLDIAASEFGRNGHYRLGLEARNMDSGTWSDLLLEWLRRYPIVAIEDPFAEDDLESFTRFTEAAVNVAVVGDDLLVTSADRIRAAATRSACNTALIKPNQVGTLTETKAALDAALEAGWNAIVSARSGETEDVTITHLAVGWGAPMLKVGSFARSERMAKWNEGLRIAEALGGRGVLRPRTAFPWGK